MKTFLSILLLLVVPTATGSYEQHNEVGMAKHIAEEVVALQVNKHDEFVAKDSSSKPAKSPKPAKAPTPAKAPRASKPDKEPASKPDKPSPDREDRDAEKGKKGDKDESSSRDSSSSSSSSSDSSSGDYSGRSWREYECLCSNQRSSHEEDKCDYIWDTVCYKPRDRREEDFCDYIGSEECSSSDKESASLLRGGSVAAE